MIQVVIFVKTHINGERLAVLLEIQVVTFSQILINGEQQAALLG